jgi:hypothetical protein
MKALDEEQTRTTVKITQVPERIVRLMKGDAAKHGETLGEWLTKVVDGIDQTEKKGKRL